MADQGSSLTIINSLIDRYVNNDIPNNRSINITYDVVLASIAPGETLTTYYVMRAKDPDCMGTTYVTWISLNAPDSDGSEYAGYRCGASPLEDIIILFKYTQ